MEDTPEYNLVQAQHQNLLMYYSGCVLYHEARIMNNVIAILAVNEEKIS